MIDTFLLGRLVPLCSAVADWLLEGLLHTFVRKTDAENPPAVACVKV